MIRAGIVKSDPRLTVVTAPDAVAPDEVCRFKFRGGNGVPDGGANVTSSPPDQQDQSHNNSAANQEPLGIDPGNSFNLSWHRCLIALIGEANRTI